MGRGLAGQGEAPGGAWPCSGSRTLHHGDTQAATLAPGCALTSVRQQHPTCYSCSCSFVRLLALPQQPEKWLFPPTAPQDLLAKWMLLQQQVQFSPGHRNPCDMAQHSWKSDASLLQPSQQAWMPNRLSYGTKAAVELPLLWMPNLPMSSHEVFLQSHSKCDWAFPWK